jgi:hypothetical protein
LQCAPIRSADSDRTDQNIAVPVGVLAGDDDAGLVGVLAGRVARSE